jgi:hypothetical protein
MPLGWNAVFWFADKMKELLLIPFLGPFFIMFPMALAGTVLVILRDWRQAVILVMPIFVTMIVSSAKLYPFADRLIIFLIPQIILLIATSIEALITLRLRYFGLAISSVAMAALLLHPIRWNAARLLVPQNFGIENFRDVLTAVESYPKCNDSIYIHKSAENHYKYYRYYRGLDPSGKAKIFTNADLPEIIKGGRRCFWIIYCHIADVDKDIVKQSLTIGRYSPLDTVSRIGASATLYVLEDR